jgi:hypothetical protein
VWLWNVLPERGPCWPSRDGCFGGNHELLDTSSYKQYIKSSELHQEIEINIAIQSVDILIPIYLIIININNNLFLIID